MHALEHATFLLAALLFWAPIVRADPSPSVLSYPAKILYLFVAMPAMALLGLTIVSANDVLYPTYAQAEGVARALAGPTDGRGDHVGGHDVPDRSRIGFVLCWTGWRRRARGPRGWTRSSTVRRRAEGGSVP